MLYFFVQFKKKLIFRPFKRLVTLRPTESTSFSTMCFNIANRKKDFDSKYSTLVYPKSEMHSNSQECISK